ncbi:putative Speckle-type POZ protein-like [Hypsibius exemplaris]|uniref:Speckle-type POZ protein-like n=1 Tax=Hypsibius exemplaris TaxID=2072580 RepID=A0A1W0WM30_HYPEX|nr:putative Speckle-type POZ protein-like [Hypsibius exemplaris]
MAFPGMNTYRQTCFTRALVIGESGVGKSSLIARLIRNDFDPYIKSSDTSMCGDFQQSQALIDGQPVTAELWGISGKGVACNRIQVWYGGGFPTRLNGMLKSIRAGQRAVSCTEAKAFADSYGINFVETSCMTGVNISYAFPPVIWEVFYRVRLAREAEGQLALERASMSEHYLKMYLKGDFTDFTIMTSDGRQLLAHRSVLAARSEVFRSMLTHKTKENSKRCCKISDIDGETMDAVLRFMYGGCLTGIDNLGPIVEKVLRASGKYAVDGLFHACQLYLINTINMENAARLLVLADMHSAWQLRELTLRFTARNLNAFMAGGGGVELDDYGQGLKEELVRFSTLRKPPSPKSDQPSSVLPPTSA